MVLKILVDYIPWILAVIFILFQILSSLGITDRACRSLVIGPYEYAYHYLPIALRKEGMYFFLITGELDFIDEPWGERLLNAMSSRFREGLVIKILISGDPNKPHVIERIKKVHELGFQEGENILTYFISGGLQAAALNENECLIKDGDPRFKPQGKKLKNLDEQIINKLAEAEDKKDFHYIKEKANEMDPHFVKKLEKKYPGRFNIHWKDEECRFCIKRTVVKKFTEKDLRKLVEGYFHGPPTGTGDEMI